MFFLVVLLVLFFFELFDADFLTNGQPSTFLFLVI